MLIWLQSFSLWTMATQIVIVHIGDIHIRDAHNPVLSRIDRIAAAIRAQQLLASAVFIVVAGDIAYSGKPEEYALAESFFF